jgi:multiple antibiotic resistance protein
MSKMAIEVFFDNFIKSFVLLFIIIDPFIAFAAFISMTRGMTHVEKMKQSYTAVLVAFAMAVAFLFGGAFVLKILGISMNSFVAAGGMILMILGVQEVLGIKTKNEKENKDMVAIVIGTPLLCGPGTMTTIIMLSQEQGYLAPLLAAASVLLITWILLIFSEKISEILGPTVIEVLSRLMGFLLVAMAAEFLKKGIEGMINDFKLIK